MKISVFVLLVMVGWVRNNNEMNSDEENVEMQMDKDDKT